MFRALSVCHCSALKFEAALRALSVCGLTHLAWACKRARWWLLRYEVLLFSKASHNARGLAFVLCQHLLALRLNPPLF